MLTWQRLHQTTVSFHGKSHWLFRADRRFRGRVPYCLGIETEQAGIRLVQNLDVVIRCGDPVKTLTNGSIVCVERLSPQQSHGA
jgi:hypothetical protein